MVSEAKQRAAKVRVDQENMKNAACNVWTCELAEAGELKQNETAERVGVSRFVVRRVVPHSLEYWKEWLGKVGRRISGTIRARLPHSAKKINGSFVSEPC